MTINRAKRYSKLTSVLAASSVLISGLIISVPSVNAATFNFSYSWGEGRPGIETGSRLLGTVRGDLQDDGNTILNPDLVQASWTNAAQSEMANFTTNELVFGTPGVLTLNGSNISFGGATSEPFNSPFYTFGLLSGDDAFVVEFIGRPSSRIRGGEFRAVEAFASERWEIEQVPEPLDTLQISLSILGVSLFLYRRKRFVK